MDPETAKPKFIKEVLLKCLRLSYHQRIIDVVPDNFTAFVPEKPAPHFKFAGDAGSGETTNMKAAVQAVCQTALALPEDVEGCNLSAKLAEAIKQKCSQEEVQALLKEDDKEEPAAAAADQQFSSHRISVFVQTLLNLGSKSFSHSFAAIAKFHPTLKVRRVTTPPFQQVDARYSYYYRL